MDLESLPLPWFLQQLQPHRPDIVEIAQQANTNALAPGALDTKTKLLMRLALDITVGARLGTQHLGDICRVSGATDDEVAETIAVVTSHAMFMRLAVGCLALAGASLPDIATLRAAGVADRIGAASGTDGRADGGEALGRS